MESPNSSFPPSPPSPPSSAEGPDDPGVDDGPAPAHGSPVSPVFYASDIEEDPPRRRSRRSKRWCLFSLRSCRRLCLRRMTSCRKGTVIALRRGATAGQKSLGSSATCTAGCRRCSTMMGSRSRRSFLRPTGCGSAVEPATSASLAGIIRRRCPTSTVNPTSTVDADLTCNRTWSKIFKRIVMITSK